MTEETENVEVEVAATEEPVVEMASAPEIAPEEGIQELKRKLASEQQARQDAERRAQQANAQVKRAYVEVEDTNYQLVTNAIDTVKGRSEALRGAYAEAMSVGDYAKAAEVQEAMSTNAFQLAELERGRIAMEGRAQQARAQAEQQAQQPSDHIERLAAAVSPTSAAWLRENRAHIGDERAVKRMFRAHEDAVDDGLEPDSPEYFQFIESRLGVRREAPPAAENPLSSAAAPATPRRSSAPPAAPVSRGNATRPNVVRLSREEADLAASWGYTPEEYATHKNNLVKEGRISK